MKSAERAKWLKENADTELNGEADKKLKAAASVDDLLAALEKRIDRGATPGPVPKGGLVLQPTDERRRSGSHYTPRSFTEPIVRKTLEPILNRFGEHPTPAQILELKICDIAVGSAAFLVETCRQLGDALVKAWRHHGGRPPLPDDETEELLAMRTVVQRCLYGVDRNPMAVDLAKLSLWLVTLAKDHPFTFVDHAIRCGDSLVGLTRSQIEDFTWHDTRTSARHFFSEEVRKRTAAALRERQNLLGLGDDYGTPQLKREKLEKADELLDLVRFIGDAAVAAFFVADKDKAREAKRAELAERLSDYLGKGELKQRPIDEVKALRSGKFPVMPFHWEIEFPEVFDRENPGFDGIVGNPPYLGSVGLSKANAPAYTDYLRIRHEDTGGKTDLAAFFLRSAFDQLRHKGALGFVTTQTICQGDTRTSGLKVVLGRGGQIYSAQKRLKWPGVAAVIVSLIHVLKSEDEVAVELNGQRVSRISAFLLESSQDDVASLHRGEPIAALGNKPNGKYFCFSDNESHLPLALKDELLTTRPSARGVLMPYLGGSELNEMIGDFDDRWIADLTEIADEGLPTFSRILDALRLKLPPNPRDDWWRFEHYAADLRSAIRKNQLDRVLCIAESSDTFAFAFLPTTYCISNTIIAFTSDRLAHFGLLQSRIHETWVRGVSSTLKDDPRYVPDVCYANYPFPHGWHTNTALEAAGREYYEFRAALMVRNNEGLTKTYNRFHDPEERLPDILKLRDLHAAMDAAVLTAYGWDDLIPKCTCEFLLDYEDEEEDGSEGKARKRKKPWRYRWPDEIRDEVLARLLKLNAERAKEEELTGAAAAVAKPVKAKRAAKKHAEPKEQIGLRLAPITKLRKHSKGINFKRGAIAAYAVNRLGDRWEFGRTQMEKALYGAQQIAGVDLEMEFMAFAQGPFDKEIHQIESLANKEGWFHSQSRKGGKGVAYLRGANIQDRCGAATTILGDKRAEFDRILDWMAKMNSTQAGIWTTVHKVWNDLIIALKPVNDDAIVKGFYEFHEAKADIEEKSVRSCIKWMRDNNFVPRGIHFDPYEPESQQADLFG